MYNLAAGDNGKMFDYGLSLNGITDPFTCDRSQKTCTAENLDPGTEYDMTLKACAKDRPSFCSSNSASLRAMTSPLGK